MTEEKVVMEGDPLGDDEISIAGTEGKSLSAQDAATLQGLHRVQQSMLSLHMARGSVSVVPVKEQHSASVGAGDMAVSLSGVSTADDPKLDLYKLLMKNRPAGVEDVSYADPASGMPYSKVHAKKLDISKNGPLSRNVKVYAKPWNETPKQFVRDPRQPNPVGRCILSLRPLARDLVYAPQLSQTSTDELGSVGVGAGASQMDSHMGYYPPGVIPGSYTSTYLDTNSQATFSDGQVPVIGSSLESQSIVVPGTGVLQAGLISAPGSVAMGGVAALASVVEE
jgi:hypothetical protein